MALIQRLAFRWRELQGSGRRNSANRAERGELNTGMLVDGAIVASVMAGYEGHRGWLNYVAVDPAHQRHGLGKAIVAQAEARLRQSGCPKINLQVRTGNSVAIEFWERVGYVRDDVVSMGKRLEVDPPPA